MFFGFVALLWTCVRASFACPNWYAAMTSILLMVLSTFSTTDPVTESSCFIGSAVVLSSITSRWHRDAELKNKDAELERKSHRILELAPTLFYFSFLTERYNSRPYAYTLLFEWHDISCGLVTDDEMIHVISDGYP